MVKFLFKLKRGFFLHLLVAILFGFLFFYSPGSLAVAPSGSWMSYHTPHFEVIYPKGLDEIAQKYGHYGELAHKLLSPLFHEAPKKTILLIDPSQDIANGFATFFPYPLITIYPTLPDTLKSISDYDNWALTLTLHEYTHILTFEPVHGFYTPFKYIFGQIVRPNSLLPSWFHEGLAIEMETRFTQQGRLRSPQTSAEIRALVEGHRLFGETIDRINEASIPTWPFGQRRYLNGSLLWNHIINKYGVNSVPILLDSHSRRPPYFLNGPVKKYFHRSYKDLLKEAYVELEVRAQEQISRIQEQASPTNRSILIDGLVQHSPSVSPNGHYLTLFNFHRFRGFELMILNRDEKVIKKIKGRNFLKVSWAKDSQFFIYDKLASVDSHNTSYDLYQYNLESQKSQRLTNGQRAREPSLSPNGSQVAYIKTRPGGTGLYLMDLSRRHSWPLYLPNLQIRLSQPEFINDYEILFVERDLSGKEVFWVYNLQTQTKHRVLKEFSTVRHPRSTKEGVIFSSRHSGVSNLYLSDPLLKQAQPITNTTTEIINGDWDPIYRKVYFTNLTAQGRQVFVQSDIEITSPPTIKPLVQYSKGKGLGQDPTPYKSQTRPYNPFIHLLPTHWLPFIYPIEDGVLFQGITNMSDPLKRHNYTLGISADTLTKKLGGSLSYVYKTNASSVGLSHSIFQEPILNRSQTFTHQTSRLHVNFPIYKLPSQWRGYSAIHMIKTDLFSRTFAKRQGFSIGLTYSNSFQLGSDYYQFSLNYTKNYQIEGFDKTPYDRTYGNFTLKTSYLLPDSHTMFLKSQIALAPKLKNLALGDKTIGGKYIANIFRSSFLLRGYPSGDFIGKKIINVNLEYNYPLVDIFMGKDLFPIFLKQLYNQLFIDYVSIDGAFVNKHAMGFERVGLGRGFWGIGTEFKLSLTVGYHIPIDLNLGLYYGLDQEARGGFTPFLGIGMSGF